jgi:hypothetical protein
MDDRRPTLFLHDRCEPTGSDTAPENVRRTGSLVYCGTDRQVSEGFAIALRVMGLDTSFLHAGVAPATNTPNSEDN